MSSSDEPLAFLHGRFQTQSAACLPLHDAGFVMGATVTDLCRTFRQRLYRWPEHLARFGRNCSAAGIQPALSAEEISRCAGQLLAHNSRLLQADRELALVLFATPGPIGYYLGQSGDGPPTFGMHTFELPLARLRSLVENGASLLVPGVRQVPGDVVDPHVKQRSRMHWWLAQQEVKRQDPQATALLLDHVGRVTETAAANFLIVRRGTVISPPLSSVLAGISLGVVRELCGKLNVPFAEEPLSLKDCLSADEAMLSNTTWCLAGVSRLQGEPLPFPGPVLRRLLAAWNEEVGLDIHEQIAP